jgi:hypothetical protein
MDELEAKIREEVTGEKMDEMLEGKLS